MGTKTKTITPEQLEQKKIDAELGLRPEEIIVTGVSLKKVTANITVQRCIIVDEVETGDPVKVGFAFPAKGDKAIHPDFKDAMNMLKPHLLILCHQPESLDYDENGVESVTDPSEFSDESLEHVTVTGFSISGEGVDESIVITGSKVGPRDKVMPLNTPSEGFLNENQPYDFIDELVRIIDHCRDEAKAYYFGKVAPSVQGDLFEEIGGEDDDPIPGFSQE